MTWWPAHGAEQVNRKPYFFSLEETAVDLERPFLLIFFNVACHVCWDELFTWRDFIQLHQIPVPVVGVTRDPEEAVIAFLRKYAVSLPVVIDVKGRLFRQHQVRAEPFLLLLQGKRILYQDNLLEPISRRKEKLQQCLLSLH